MRQMAPSKVTAEEAAKLHPAPVMTASKINRLRLLAQDPNSKIRERAALDYHVPEDVASALAADPDPAVRACVARNETVSCDILRTLADDPDEHVRGFVAINYFVPDDAMERLRDDKSPVVRKLVAWKTNLQESETQ